MWSSSVCVAGLDPEDNACGLNAQTPEGEIETGSKCERQTWPGGGNGLRNNIAPFAFPSHDFGVARRQPRPHVVTKATDCFFTHIRHSVR